MKFYGMEFFKYSIWRWKGKYPEKRVLITNARSFKELLVKFRKAVRKYRSKNLEVVQNLKHYHAGKMLFPRFFKSAK